MAAFAITEGVWAVGVQNPNLRVFDIVMATAYGTTYNAYLVRGEKTALIETVHRRFFDAYLENIQSVCDLESIDYLILNHCEPDHSGSVGALLERCPNLTVVASPGGSINIKQITNRPDLPVRTVKEGDTLDLGGGKVLSFTMVPFVHWPDTMFTYDAADRMIFTCDFLGAHYCEPLMLDTKIPYPEAYESAFKGYYDAIMGPFKPYVRAGLSKLEKYDFDYVGTSHGPILTKGGRYAYCVERYRAWSAERKNDRKTIPIFYTSAYGCTAKAAEMLREGVLEAIPDADCACYDIIEHPMAELAERLNTADAFMIGSPTLNKDAVPPVWELISHIDAINGQKKPCLVFGSYGWSGEAVPMMADRLRALKLAVYEETLKFVFVASEADLERAKALGHAFAASL